MHRRLMQEMEGISQGGRRQLSRTFLGQEMVVLLIAVGIMENILHMTHLQERKYSYMGRPIIWPQRLLLRI